MRKLAGRSGTAKGVNRQGKVLKLTTAVCLLYKVYKDTREKISGGKKTNYRPFVAAGIKRGMWGCEFWHRYDAVQG